MKKIMFGIAGEMLSGKSTAAKFLLDHFRVKQVTMSAVLNDVLAILDLPITRENQQMLAKLLREEFGEGVLGKATGAIAAQAHDKMVMIDGIRKFAELEELKKNHNFKLIYINAPLEVRYARLKNREEKQGENLKTLDEFRASHTAEAEIDIRKLEQQADYTIENTGDEEHLHDELTKLITENI